jgi:hypothetical protein
MLIRTHAASICNSAKEAVEDGPRYDDCNDGENQFEEGSHETENYANEKGGVPSLQPPPSLPDDAETYFFFFFAAPGAL